jgi:hypothetical protein
MNRCTHILFSLSIASLLFGCDRKKEYSLTEADAMKVNSAFAVERLDSFGGGGPYSWTGSSGYPRGTGGLAWVTVRGQKINKELPKLGEDEWYVIEQFENAEKDGFAVVYKYASKAR